MKWRQSTGWQGSLLLYQPHALACLQTVMKPSLSRLAHGLIHNHKEALVPCSLLISQENILKSTHQVVPILPWIVSRSAEPLLTRSKTSCTPHMNPRFHQHPFRPLFHMLPAQLQIVKPWLHSANSSSLSFHGPLTTQCSPYLAQMVTYYQ